MGEFQITYDGELPVRSGEVIAILKGIKKGDSIRATLVETSSKVVYRSRIDGTLMTEMPVPFEPLILGKVIGRIGVASGTTAFRIKEVTKTSKPRRKKFSRAEEKAIWKRSEGKCAICERPTDFDEGEIDHIIPLAKGGTNDFDNLQWLCLRCNRLKGHTKTNEEVRKLVTK